MTDALLWRGVRSRRFSEGRWGGTDSGLCHNYGADQARVRYHRSGSPDCHRWGYVLIRPIPEDLIEYKARIG